jgi:hypothetical protein
MPLNVPIPPFTCKKQPLVELMGTLTLRFSVGVNVLKAKDLSAESSKKGKEKLWKFRVETF